MIARLIASRRPASILFWGPPGCGKTTLARLYAQAFDAPFIAFSAVFHGISDLKKLIEEARRSPLLHRVPIVFVDEIHRFNKAQQDAFLPFVEDGTVILIGATTENPSFSLNNALLSRLQVIPLSPLSSSALEKILVRYETQFAPLLLSPSARTLLIELAQGDGRYLLNMVESLQDLSEVIDAPDLLQFVQKRAALYDKNDDGHHDLISALHKSVRGSDPDAALYYLCRMLEGGEAPEYIARRIVRMAVEDVGLADPEALTIALQAWRAFDQLGSPEGELALAQACVYLALAPKSNALYIAYGKARAYAAKTSHLKPPKTILNAPSSLMKKLGHGKGYLYDHDTELGFSGQDYFPEGRMSFYEPVERGFEREMKKRLDFFSKRRN